MCGGRLSSLSILCTFGIQVWEFALCYIIWIRPSFRDESTIYMVCFWTSCTWFWLYSWNCMLHDQCDLNVTYLRNLNFEVIFVAFRLMKNIIFNKIESFVGRNTSDHACQMFCSKCNCETMYHWFVLLEITVVKILNNLNVFSAHNYLYPGHLLSQKTQMLQFEGRNIISII